MATDGSRLYLTEYFQGHYILTQVAAAGGETSEISTPFRNVFIDDISPDHSQLLVGAAEVANQEAPLWAVPLPSGSPRRLGDAVSSQVAAYSPDGQRLAFTKGSQVFLAKADGSDARSIASVQGVTGYVRFSPDGSRLRFTVGSPVRAESSLWEVKSDGSNLHQLFPGWHSSPADCCGVWTPDGSHYLFISATSSGSDVYDWTDRPGLFRRAPAAPVRLTTGPLAFFSVLPSSDGKKLFVAATQPRAQLVRYDDKARQFTPFLGGISASDLAFSPDGQWVAYVSLPDNSLWRSKLDGSQRLQLTYPPGLATLPSWSPDSSRIAFTDNTIGKSWSARVISAQGGSSEPLLPDGSGAADFNWSPDGSQIIYSYAPGNPDLHISVLDLKTHQVSRLPGSEGLFSPRHSPDGRYLTATSRDFKTLMLFEFATQKWSKWITEPGNISYPSWSSDSKYVYFDNFFTDHPNARRVKLGDAHSEELFSLSGIRQFQGTPSGTWSGLAPDGSRLYVQDLSAQEIYALDVEFP